MICNITIPLRRSHSGRNAINLLDAVCHIPQRGIDICALDTGSTTHNIFSVCKI